MKVICTADKKEYDLLITGSPVEEKMTCPVCSHTRKKSKDKCLGWNNSKMVGRCVHCESSFFIKHEKETDFVYEKPVWTNKTSLSTEAVKWFESRKISQKTIEKLRITEGIEWMPGINKEVKTLQFNYFRDNSLVNVKYRGKGKIFKMFKGAELIFYNLDAIKDATEIYIVEGEMDCAAMVECGIENVVSVPNGASAKNNNMQYLDNCIDYFIGKKIHLALDNDLPGRKLRDDIADRIGKEFCDYIEFGEFKDANDCLVALGIQGVMDSVSKPKLFPLEGAFTIDDISDEIDDMYENGLDRGVSTFIPGFDCNIVKGYLYVITGIPSHGKSDWLDNICLNLKIFHNYDGAFYSPENKPTQLHFSKMARKLIGKHWDGNGKMSKEEVDMVKKYLNKSFWFIKPEKDFTLSSILSKIKNIQIRYGLDFFVIDAWNKLEHKGKGDTEYIGMALDEIALFCEINHITCFLVAHPTKIPKNKDNQKYEVPTLYNISGSSNFYNKADVGLCIYRDFETGKTVVYRQKIKFDHWGTEGDSEYEYEVNSKRYFASGSQFDYSNWITKKHEKSESDKTEHQFNPNLHIEPNKEFTLETEPGEDPFI